MGSAVFFRASALDSMEQITFSYEFILRWRKQKTQQEVGIHGRARKKIVTSSSGRDLL